MSRLRDACERQLPVVSSSRGGDFGDGGGGRCTNAGRRTAESHPTAYPSICCFCLSYMRERRLFGSLHGLFSRSRVSAEQRQQLGHVEEIEYDECQVEGAEEEDELRIIVDLDLTALARIRLHKPITMAGGTQKRNMHETELFTEYGEASQYEIIEVVGKGSYGVVGAAVESHTGEKVAIKKINDVFEHFSDATRILTEIKLLRLLRHPDIVEIKHIMLLPSRRKFRDIYVVFELMESDHHQVIKANDNLNPEHHQFFLYQLLRALKYILSECFSSRFEAEKHPCLC